MKYKIYVSANGLPNTNYILSIILNKLELLDITYEIVIVHDSNFDSSLFKNIYDLNLRFVLSDDNLYEYPALRTLWLDSQNDEFYGLYLHTKGASKVKYNELQNSVAWMEYMMFGVLDNLKSCIKHLNEGADLVGSMWYNHFKGNFFWFKSSYIKTLLDPYHFTITDRFNAEYWISMPFDSHWFNVAKQYFGLNLSYPSIKNLFYLPINNDLTDFLKLKNSNYMPDINKKVVTDDIHSLVINNIYFAYDEIQISKENFEKIKDKLKPHLNYDSKIIIR